MQNSGYYRVWIRMRERLRQVLLQLKGSPKSIAKGLAIGVFVGMSPFLGLHASIALVLSALFRGNPVSALIGIQVTNVVTAPFVYALTYKVGVLFYDTGISFRTSDFFSYLTLQNVYGTLKGLIITLCIGGFISGLPLAILSYFSALYLSKTFKKNFRKDRKFIIPTHPHSCYIEKMSKES